MQPNISTLAELLEAAGTQWRVYDMGRRITKIDKNTFAKIENAQIPYPMPIQKHALLAILFWDAKATDEPYIWFLKLPLDEQSKLVQASRDHFASMVLEALGTQLTGAQEGQQLNNNPYVFTPNANKRAAFNALMKVETNKPASIYFEPTELYFSGKLGFADWQSLALQGIADFAFRLDKSANEDKLIKALTQLPSQVLTPLAAMLENVPVSVNLAEQLKVHIKTAIAENNTALLINWLRCLSHTPAQKLLEDVIDEILAHDELSQNIDVILTITGRAWLTLTQPQRLHLFMDQVAKVEEPIELFAGVFADLVAIDTIRPHLLKLLRAEDRSQHLAIAIGRLFS